MYYLFPKLSEITVENVSITLVRVTGDTAQKMKFSIKDFSSKCDKICGKLWIWSHLLEKSLMENFIFCAVRMIADIFYPICTLTITVLACFIRKKAKLFGGLQQRLHQGIALDTPDPQLQSFLALPKTDAPIFFLYHPLIGRSKCYFV